MKKNRRPEKLLTDVELELMTLLWRLGEGTVAEILESLPPDRKLAYTSVSTMMRIMEQKEIVKARKEGRGHVYSPLLAKEDYERKTVRHVVDKVFEGTPVALVRQLLDSGAVSAKELAELKQMIVDYGNDQ